MLPRIFSRNDHYLCSSYFQPMDPADLTYEKKTTELGPVVGDNSSFFILTISEDENVRYRVGIDNRLCTSFRFDSQKENQFRCLIFILCLRSPCNAEIRLRLLSLLDKKSDVKMSRRRLKSPLVLMLILRRTSSSWRLPYQRRRCQSWNEDSHIKDFYEQFNEAKLEQQEKINLDEAEL
ncbi:unnamed protein product [Hymenolepis diminuta]|uniref:Uncharacterized protein n=1 Tax=Hymenolepis diminuta TaxID=6216 RepID=A0A564Y105_HYMDI|nr:unnamed protein product [Hymenolepis diminuta]